MFRAEVRGLGTDVGEGVRFIEGSLLLEDKGHN